MFGRLAIATPGAPDQSGPTPRGNGSHGPPKRIARQKSVQVPVKMADRHRFKHSAPPIPLELLSHGCWAFPQLVERSWMVGSSRKRSSSGSSKLPPGLSISFGGLCCLNFGLPSGGWCCLPHCYGLASVMGGVAVFRLEIRVRVRVGQNVGRPKANDCEKETLRYTRCHAVDGSLACSCTNEHSPHQKTAAVGHSGQHQPGRRCKHRSHQLCD